MSRRTRNVASPSAQPTASTSSAAAAPSPLPSSMALTANTGAGPATLRANPNKTTAKAVPAFLNKLYNMVNDETTDDLIRWSEDGDSFFVPSADKFGRELLPRFFKHSNFGSFVRQLNMYGFHKVPHLQQGVLKTDSEETSELLEFSNPNFARSQPDLLCLIKRQKAKNDAPVAQETALDLPSLLTDLAAVRKHQAALSADLKGLQTSNNALWQEAIQSRERHTRHQDTINKILRFLATVFGGQVVGQEGEGSTPGSSNIVVDEEEGSVDGDKGKGKATQDGVNGGFAKLPTPMKRKARFLLEDVKGRPTTNGGATINGADDEDEEIEEIPARPTPPRGNSFTAMPTLSRSSSAPAKSFGSFGMSSADSPSFTAPDSTSSRFTTLPPTPQQTAAPSPPSNNLEQQYTLPPDYLASLLSGGNNSSLEALLHLQNASAGSAAPSGFTPPSSSLALLPSPSLQSATLPNSSAAGVNANQNAFATLYDPSLAPNSLMSDPDYSQQISDNNDILQDVQMEKEQLDHRTAELELAIKNIMDNLPPDARDQVMNGLGGGGNANGATVNGAANGQLGLQNGTGVDDSRWGIDNSTGDDDLDKLLAQYVNTNGESTGDSLLDSASAQSPWNPFPPSSALGTHPAAPLQSQLYETFTPSDTASEDGFSGAGTEEEGDDDFLDDGGGSAKKKRKTTKGPQVEVPASPAASEGTRRSSRKRKA